MSSSTSQIEVRQAPSEPPVAWLIGANMKVTAVVLAHLCYGWDVAELTDQFPHPTPEQVQAALDDCAQHQAVLDAPLAGEFSPAEKLRETHADYELQRRFSRPAALYRFIS